MFKKINLKNSNKFFKETSKIIPLSSQTFSKSYLIYNKNKFPIFCTKGKNQYLYDLDNNTKAKKYLRPVKRWDICFLWIISSRSGKCRTIDCW